MAARGARPSLLGAPTQGASASAAPLSMRMLRRGLSKPLRLEARFWSSVGVAALVAVAAVVLVCYNGNEEDLSLWEAEQMGSPRRLISEAYPNDLFLTKDYWKDDKLYFLVFHVICIVYMLIALNTVCEVYFTGAIDVLVEEWKIKPDVAGATFMAAGGSMPELFTSFIGMYVVSDVGFSTIVGSAVFNVLFVIGACGFCAKEAIDLSWWPLFRDCSFYIVALLVLAVCCSDGKVNLAEAVLLFCMYLLYCGLMTCNDRLEAIATGKRSRVAPETDATQDPEKGTLEDKKGEENNNTADETPPEIMHPKPEGEPDAEKKGAGGEDEKDEGGDADDLEALPRTTIEVTLAGKAEVNGKYIYVEGTPPHPYDENSQEEYYWTLEETPVKADEKEPRPIIFRENTKFGGTGEWVISLGGNRLYIGGGTDMKPGQMKSTQSADDDLLPMPKFTIEVAEEDFYEWMEFPRDGGMKDKVVWFFCAPVYYVLCYTVPKPSPKFFMLTFALSLVWIMCFSFVLVWFVEILGDVIFKGEPKASVFMGFTILAAGTSIPDAVSSVAVARKGFGDMAVSSSIGSNIFDILFGLPVPWMIKTGCKIGGQSTVVIESPFMAFYTLLLLGMVFLTIASIHFVGWKLNKTLGLCMVILYAVFLVIALSVEEFKPSFLIV